MSDEINPLLERGESGFPVAFEQAMSLLMNEMHKIVETECKITFLIRTPGEPDRDICWTEDEPTDVLEMATRTYERTLPPIDAADITIAPASGKIDGILGIIKDD